MRARRLQTSLAKQLERLSEGDPEVLVFDTQHHKYFRVFWCNLNATGEMVLHVNEVKRCCPPMSENC